VVILLMGVSGSGKTTVGQLLASQLGWEFADGDDYHPAANVEKMRNGIPLTDADRALRGTPELLRGRLRARVGHFMTERMLESQLAALEEPEDAVVVDVDRSPAEIVAEILARLGLKKT
jgi:gluconokinase